MLSRLRLIPGSCRHDVRSFTQELKEDGCGRPDFGHDAADRPIPSTLAPFGGIAAGLMAITEITQS